MFLKIDKVLSKYFGGPCKLEALSKMHYISGILQRFGLDFKQFSSVVFFARTAHESCF